MRSSNNKAYNVEIDAEIESRRRIWYELMQYEEFYADFPAKPTRVGQKN